MGKDLYHPTLPLPFEKTRGGKTSSNYTETLTREQIKESTKHNVREK